ncbi:hypothetical protein [Ilumatobacter sp.]|uniref:hypothetical protein n=1 Tax=Ilumatobacter sp. TaxID=1967498 RepID=UPI003B517C2A
MSTWKDVRESPGHLVARFFTSLSAAPPTIDDENWVEDVLSTPERSLWIRLSNQDRRHSVGVARCFAEGRPSATRAEVAGALLHDVGKIDCELGTFERVVATLVGPRTRRFRSYHLHEEIGARMAALGGSDPATVALIAAEGPAYDDLERCDH